jgi:hypothetical protein
MLSSEPTIFIPDPIRQPKIKCTKYSMHTGLSEFAIVIDPASDFGFQKFCNLSNVKMYHAVYFELKTSLIDPPLALTANCRRKTKFDSASGFDYPRLECKSKEVKGSTLLLFWKLLLLIAVAVHYFRFASVKVSFKFL